MDDGRWVTINGAHVFVKNNQNIMDAFIRQKGGKKDNYIDIDEVTFQDESYGKYIEKEDVGRIEAFKDVLKTGKDHKFEQFQYEDISAPIVLRKEKRNGKYIMYDGQHRYIAYKQLGYKKIPYIFK